MIVVQDKVRKADFLEASLIFVGTYIYNGFPRKAVKCLESQKKGGQNVFNVGDELSSQEMVERLGITRRMWDTKRQKYLDYLAQFYDIETKGYGMSRRYFIKRQ